MTLRRALLAVSLSLLLPAAAFGHGASRGTFDDIQEAIFERSCAVAGCHLGANAGGLSLEWGESWAELLDFGFGKRPTNGAAAGSLKMRVDPGRPWNSFLVDKLRGRLKHGEMEPMPLDQGLLDECEIREIERWILAGAPQIGWVDGDERHSGVDGCNVEFLPECVIDPCQKTQPALAAPPTTEGEVQIHVLSPVFTGHDVLHEDEDVPSDAPAGFVTRIAVTARPGTERVEVSRKGDEVPFMVALFDPTSLVAETDVLELPAGTGVPVDANQAFAVRQAILADAFDPANASAVAESYVTLEIDSTSALQTLEPFLETSGTEMALAPARLLGAAGGVWNGGPVAALRVWGDRRAIRSLAVAPGGIVYESTGARGASYSVPDDPIEPAIVYACEHDNTHLAGAPRWGCGNPIRTVSGYPVPPPGMPAALGGEGSAPWCAAEADCAADCVLPPCCVPANHVGGEGVEDARCALVGLRIAP